MVSLLALRVEGHPICVEPKTLNLLIDWLTEWCLTSNGKYFMHIQDESMLMMSDDEWTLLCTRLTCWIFNMLANENNSLHEDMPLYPDTLFWLWADPSLLLPLNAVCLVEKQLIPILMSLVWPCQWSIPQPSAIEVETLTITPPRRSVCQIHILSKED